MTRSCLSLLLVVSALVLATPGCELTLYAYRNLAQPTYRTEPIPADLRGEIQTVEAVSAIRSGDALVLYVRVHCDDGATRVYRSNADCQFDVTDLSTLPQPTVDIYEDRSGRDQVSSEFWQRREIAPGVFARPELSRDELSRAFVYFTRPSPGTGACQIAVSIPHPSGRPFEDTPAGPLPVASSLDTIVDYNLTGPLSRPSSERFLDDTNTVGMLLFFCVAPLTLTLDVPLYVLSVPAGLLQSLSPDHM